jgi:hypothetical protein
MLFIGRWKDGFISDCGIDKGKKGRTFFIEKARDARASEQLSMNQDKFKFKEWHFGRRMMGSHQYSRFVVLG